MNFSKTHPYIWSFFKRRKWAVLATCFILLAQAALTIILPLPLGFIFDQIIKSQPGVMHEVILKGIYLGKMETTYALYFLCIAGFIGGMVLLFLEWLEQMVTTQTTFVLSEELRQDLFKKIFTRKQSYIDSKKKVDIMARISPDIVNFDIIFCIGVRAVVNSVPTIAMMLFMMFSINTPFTMRFMIALPIFAALMYYYAKKQRLAQRALRKKTVAFETQTVEAISSLAIIKSFRGEDRLLTKLINQTIGITRENEKTRNAAVGMESSMGATYVIIRNILVCLGAIWVFNGRISMGDILIFMSYMGSIIKPINDINKFAEKYPKCAVSMDRIEELHNELQQNPEISGNKIPDLTKIKESEAFISLDKITFQYNDSRKIFDNFSAKFKPHSLIAIVGQSGIGKSSFSRLLNRLQDPQSGQIKLGDTNLPEFEIKALRSCIRILSQETFLISGSIRENLNLASKDDKNDGELEAALEKVNALEFIRALPSGLDTKIGEGGQQLSGGQAKRIHLARAFLDTDSSIFLFDEPTTGLDAITAQRVLKAVQELARTRSLVFWVTHRMEEVHQSSNVLFFVPDQNPIYSTHVELNQTNMQYRALIEADIQNTSPRLVKIEPLSPIDPELGLE